jgi:hypothetical protein
VNHDAESVTAELRNQAEILIAPQTPQPSRFHSCRTESTSSMLIHDKESLSRQHSVRTRITLSENGTGNSHLSKPVFLSEEWGVHQLWDFYSGRDSFGTYKGIYSVTALLLCGFLLLFLFGFVSTSHATSMRLSARSDIEIGTMLTKATSKAARP